MSCQPHGSHFESQSKAIIDFEGICSIFIEYYKELFSTVDPIFPSDLDKLYLCTLLGLSTMGFEDIPNEEEIQKKKFFRWAMIRVLALMVSPPFSLSSTGRLSKLK